jgi:hypothetical protein
VGKAYFSFKNYHLFDDDESLHMDLTGLEPE